jgi:hypothetical protein
MAEWEWCKVGIILAQGSKEPDRLGLDYRSLEAA